MIGKGIRLINATGLLTLVHLDLLKEELERVLGAGDNQLLKKVLKELIHLVIVQVALD